MQHVHSCLLVHTRTGRVQGRTAPIHHLEQNSDKHRRKLYIEWDGVTPKRPFSQNMSSCLGSITLAPFFHCTKTTCICTSLLSEYRVFKRSRNLWSGLSSIEKGALLLCSTRLRPPTRDLRVERGYFEPSVFLVSITKWQPLAITIGIIALQKISWDSFVSNGWEPKHCNFSINICTYIFAWIDFSFWLSGLLRAILIKAHMEGGVWRVWGRDLY